MMKPTFAIITIALSLGIVTAFAANPPCPGIKVTIISTANGKTVAVGATDGRGTWSIGKTDDGTKYTVNLDATNSPCVKAKSTTRGQSANDGSASRGNTKSAFTAMVSFTDLATGQTKEFSKAINAGETSFTMDVKDAGRAVGQYGTGGSGKIDKPVPNPGNKGVSFNNVTFSGFGD